MHIMLTYWNKTFYRLYTKYLVRVNMNELTDSKAACPSLQCVLRMLLLTVYCTVPIVNIKVIVIKQAGFGMGRVIIFSTELSYKDCKRLCNLTLLYIIIITS